MKWATDLWLLDCAWRGGKMDYVVMPGNKQQQIAMQ
jgi:hypothetical protein